VVIAMLYTSIGIQSVSQCCA